MKIAITALLAFIVLVTFVSLRKEEYMRIPSPDGEYYAKAEYRAFRAWVPMMPGSGGDKEGFITIFTKSGKKIGATYDLPLVWMIRDIKWSDKRVEIPLVAAWNLSQ